MWQYKGDLINPYEADLLENGNVLIGNGIGGVVYEVDRYGVIVCKYGLSYLKSVVYLNCIISMAMTSLYLLYFFTTKGWKEILRAKRIKYSVIIGSLISLFVVSLIILLTYTSITIIIFRILFHSR